MKIVENNVKYGEIITFDHKFYLKTTNFPSNFIPAVGILSKDLVPEVGCLNEKFSGSLCILCDPRITSRKDFVLKVLSLSKSWQFKLKSY